MNAYLKLESLNGKTKGIIMKADFIPNVGDCVEVTSTYPMKVVEVIEEKEWLDKHKDMPVWVEESRQK